MRGANSSVALPREESGSELGPKPHLLGQHEEPRHGGHVALPLCDQLGVDSGCQGREGGVQPEGGSNEHAEHLPLVGQLDDIITHLVWGGEFAWRRREG